MLCIDVVFLFYFVVLYAFVVLLFCCVGRYWVYAECMQVVCGVYVEYM